MLWCQGTDVDIRATHVVQHHLVKHESTQPNTHTHPVGTDPTGSRSFGTESGTSLSSLNERISEPRIDIYIVIVQYIVASDKTRRGVKRHHLQSSVAIGGRFTETYAHL